MVVINCFKLLTLIYYISKSYINSAIEMFMDQSERDIDLRLLPIRKQMKVLQTKGGSDYIISYSDRSKVMPCYMYLSKINVLLQRN